MIDTIGISIPNDGKLDTSKLKDTGNFNVVRNYKKRIDLSVKYYKYRNLLIEVPINQNDLRSIKIFGSLQKIVNNQNIFPNDLEHIKSELKKFARVLKVDLFSQNVFRVDVCKDYAVNSPQKILENIYPIKQYYRNKHKNTLYFDKWESKKYRTTCFYDKGLETGKLNNVIRHEFRMYKPYLDKLYIFTLKDIFSNLDIVELKRGENMNDFKVAERKSISLTGAKRDLILRAREVGVNEIQKQIKAEYDQKLISRRTYFNRKKIIDQNIHLIENQEFENLKNS